MVGIKIFVPWYFGMEYSMIFGYFVYYGALDHILGGTNLPNVYTFTSSICVDTIINGGGDAFSLPEY